MGEGVNICLRVLLRGVLVLVPPATLPFPLFSSRATALNTFPVVLEGGGGKTPTTTGAFGV